MQTPAPDLQPRPIPLYQVWLKTFRISRTILRQIGIAVLFGTFLPFFFFTMSKWPWAQGAIEQLKSDLPSSITNSSDGTNILTIFTYLSETLSGVIWGYALIFLIQGFSIIVVLRIFRWQLRSLKPIPIKEHLLISLKKFPIAILFAGVSLFLIILGYSIMPLIAVAGTVILLWPILYASAEGKSEVGLKSIITLNYATHLKGGRLLSLAQIVLCTFIMISFGTIWFVCIKKSYIFLASFEVSSGFPWQYILVESLAAAGWTVLSMFYVFVLLVHYHCVSMIPKFKTFV